ncbi:hypothetical protein N657DRAFT_390978 [Parathielavia appendiculata]|uniref:Uncharacterized protein n=1 Tax=Parathielavia appendiculata TaxID=2587402 RepID=A0AAN6Z501_9PEZI|nr:hypothetical protein N657DRAFT_390978 [Parathielavia appendiculata]
MVADLWQHFREAKVQQRLLDAADRLYANPTKESADDMRKMCICLAALNKPHRGHSRNLYPAGTENSPVCVPSCPLLGGAYAFSLVRREFDVDPDQFGIVDSRYQPAWKTVGDEKVDQECYDLWLKTHATMAMVRKMASLELAEQTAYLAELGRRRSRRKRPRARTTMDKSVRRAKMRTRIRKPLRLRPARTVAMRTTI